MSADEMWLEIDELLNDASSGCSAPPYGDSTALDGIDAVKRLRHLLEPVVKSLVPLAALGGPWDLFTPAFHDMHEDAVLYENSGKAITVGDVRAARFALQAIGGSHE